MPGALDKRCAILGVAAATLLTASCSMYESRVQSEALEGAALIRGVAIRNTTYVGPVNVLVFELVNGLPHYEGASYASDSGRFRFHVTPGSYWLAAHVDLNRDGRYDPGEPVSNLSAPNFFQIGAGETLDIPALVITDEPAPELTFDTSIEGSAHFENIGKVMSLDDPIFHETNYSQGLWRPMDFLRTIGGGLFLLQDYDAGKIPVLFIHGVGGGPRDWQPVIERVDNQAFQPWIYYYASGVQLDIVSDNLLLAVTELQKRYQFRTLYVAAHSVGGLVMRSFVRKLQARYPKEFSMLQLAVTVNTPFGGMDSAARGVRLSPIVIPSWRDVARGSPFLQELTAWKWPSDIPYHLVFSLDGNEGDDGVVWIADEIPWEIQKDATRIYGFDGTHVGTLSDPRFITLFNDLLAFATGSLPH